MKIKKRDTPCLVLPNGIIYDLSKNFAINQKNYINGQKIVITYDGRDIFVKMTGKTK